MKNNLMRGIANILMAATLILASCGPKAPAAPAPTPTPAPAPAPAPTPAPTPTPTPAPAPTTETPKYGGTINILQTTDILIFDPAMGSQGNTVPLTNEHFTEGDWTKGPGGTGQNDFFSSTPPIETIKGHIAESWEIPAIGTVIFKIRRGVHYALDPANEASRLVNGRELTADDAVFSVKRLVTSAPRSNLYLGAPEMARAATVEKTGPWEVTIKTPVDPWWGFIAFFYGWAFRFQTPEVVQKYGDMQNWQNSVGTGPFILMDFVPGGVATLKRNPNYWDKDPFGPGKGNQLPYVDTVKLLVITDLSTQQAALRTGRLDWASPIEAEDARSLMKTLPNLKSVRLYTSSGRVIGMRTDKSELPFKDKRVRQALMMATDFEALRNDLYTGEADVLAWPVARNKETAGAYHPLEELPDSVQALFKYNPQKAKQLLTEAGYPNGFKTRIITQNVSIWMDPLAAVKSMWAKVGVDLEIQPRELAVYNSVSNGRAYDEMLFKAAVGGRANIPTMSSFRGETHWNVSFIKDAKAEEIFQEQQKNIIINDKKVFQLYYDLMPYLLEQAYVIPTPSPYTYLFWWPWVKNYHGENTVSFTGGQSWVKYVWIDRDLKEQMTGRR